MAMEKTTRGAARDRGRHQGGAWLLGDMAWELGWHRCSSGDGDLELEEAPTAARIRGGGGLN